MVFIIVDSRMYIYPYIYEDSYAYIFIYITLFTSKPWEPISFSADDIMSTLPIYASKAVAIPTKSLQCTLNIREFIYSYCLFLPFLSCKIMNLTASELFHINDFLNLSFSCFRYSLIWTHLINAIGCRNLLRKY